MKTNRRTQAKSQWVVAQGYSTHLQYLDTIKSSAKDLSHSKFEITLDRQRSNTHNDSCEARPKAISFHVISSAAENTA